MYARSNALLATLILLTATLLAACGSDNSTIATVPPPPPPPPPPPAATIAVAQVFDQVALQSPVAMMQAPGDSSRWFVVEQSGVVRVFPNDPNVMANEVSVFIDISARVTSGNETGLLGLAFHPQFGSNNNFEVFVSYTRINGGQLESAVTRFRSIDNGQTLDDTVEEVVLTIPQDFSNHNGGNIAFGPDGFLYAGWGDGGDGGDPLDRGQDTSNLLGTFTRIDVDGGNPYAIPGDNPFVANAANPCTQGFGGADCPEIYAWGFRNPWRWSFDSQTDELWVGDVGQLLWEEVDRVVLGENYGWDEREGAHCFEPASGCATTFTDPITEYPHSNGDVSITGGYVYRGTTVTALQDSYIFGDFASGRIWSVPASSSQGAVPDELIDTDLNISSFGQDFDGELYVVDYAGRLFQIVPPP